MRMLEQMISAAGTPLSLIELRDLDGQTAAVGRWRHSDHHLETSSADALRVVLNIGSAFRVCHAEAGQVVRIAPTPGCVGVFPPGRPCRTAVNGEVDVVMVYIGTGSLWETASGSRNIPPMAVADEAVRAATVAMLVAAHKGAGSRLQKAATALGHASCKLLLSQAQQGYLCHKGGLPPAVRHRIERLIEQRLEPEAPQRRPLEVRELAARAGLSVNHFIHVFREVTGTTPHQYVMARRQQRALGLLGKPGLSVAEIGELLGFSSPAHFVASFRQKLGVTPGAYREAVLGLGGPVGGLPR